MEKREVFKKAQLLREITGDVAMVQIYPGDDREV